MDWVAGQLSRSAAADCQRISPSAMVHTTAEGSPPNAPHAISRRPSRSFSLRAGAVQRLHEWRPASARVTLSGAAFFQQ
jgi:hypothetical protein